MRKPLVADDVAVNADHVAQRHTAQGVIKTEAVLVLVVELCQLFRRGTDVFNNEAKTVSFI